MEQTNTTKRKKLVAGVTLAPEIQERVAEIARLRDWSIAQTGGYLIKLGLEKLTEIAEQQSDSPPTLKGSEHTDTPGAMSLQSVT